MHQLRHMLFGNAGDGGGGVGGDDGGGGEGPGGDGGRGGLWGVNNLWCSSPFAPGRVHERKRIEGLGRHEVLEFRTTGSCFMPADTY